MKTPPKEFQPCWWLANGHLQTIAGALIPRPTQKTHLECVQLDDGDILEFLWLEAADPKAPILLLLHGLEGSVNSGYIQGMLQAAKQQSWRAVVLHQRGGSGRINRIAQSYHAGKTDDVEFALKRIQSYFPEAVSLFAVGYSLGANMLLKFLGENPKQTWINKAVAVSVPFDLEATTRKLHKGMSRIYEQRFVNGLKYNTASKLLLNMDMPVNLVELNRIRTLYDFDDKVTAPLHGFENAHDYYQRCSCMQFLPSIQTPTLIVHAEDDPFIPKAVIPTAQQVSAYVALDIQRYGGHVGFISCGVLGRPEYWLEERVLDFFES